MKINSYIYLTILLMPIFIYSANAEMGVAPINQAIENEDLKKIKELIEQGENLNRHIEGYNSAPIITAAAQGNIEVLNLLIENGADINFIGRRRNESALHMAVDHDHLKLVEFLVENGADLEIVNTVASNLTALGLACWENNYEIVKFLVESGANIDKTQETLHAPIYWATQDASSKILSYLIDHGAKTDVNEVGGSLLNIAVYSDVENIEKIKILIKNGTDVNEIDPFVKRTALGTAAYLGNWPIAKLLLEAGADPSYGNNEGRTPKQIARRHDNNNFVVNIEKYLSAIN